MSCQNPLPIEYCPNSLYIRWRARFSSNSDSFTISFPTSSTPLTYTVNGQTAGVLNTSLTFQLFLNQNLLQIVMNNGNTINLLYGITNTSFANINQVTFQTSGSCQLFIVRVGSFSDSPQSQEAVSEIILWILFVIIIVIFFIFIFSAICFAYKRKEY